MKRQQHQENLFDQALGPFLGIRILDLHKVKTKTSLGKTTLYRLIHERKFPRPISLSANGKKVGWVEEEVDAYLRSRIEARDGGAK